MDTREKIRILSDSAKYDVSCSSSGNSRQGKQGALGNAVQGGICHSFTSDGRCISLLKILMTNYCIYDCAYCQNRVSNDIERAFFKPEELIDLTMSFYRRNYIEGLFLSSGVIKSPDHTMELMVEILKALRIREKFNGYIHVKGIPGASPYLIAEAGKFADRLSVNIELPEEADYASLTPQKNRELILRPMAQISRKISENTEEKRIFRYSEDFVPAGQSTQLIVGATPATDGKILTLSGGLYKAYGLKRVYYSAYIPVGTSALLPKLTAPPLLREHRLYQADWLLRFYKFQTEELVSPDENLDVNVDPKTQWALRNMHLFPVEVNRASFDMLLRIPGVGLISAERMAKARRLSPLTWDGLKRMGIVLKRAKHFILVSGRYYGSFSQDPDMIYSALSERKDEIQTDLFDKIDTQEPAIRIKSHVPKLIQEPVPLPGKRAALAGGES